jgi:hypothetical protein
MIVMTVGMILGTTLDTTTEFIGMTTIVTTPMVMATIALFGKNTETKSQPPEALLVAPYLAA